MTFAVHPADDAIYRQRARQAEQHADQQADVIARRLANRRRALGLSQAYVAHLLGTKQSHISAIELGITRPGIDTLGKIAHLYGMGIAATEPPPTGPTISG